MNFTKKNLELLACPICKRHLELSSFKKAGEEIISGRLNCCSCDEDFEIKKGIPCLIPEIFSQTDKYKEWEEKQKYGLGAYKNVDLEYKRFITPIKKMFGIFCQHQGTILDIGCGINPKLDYFNKEINRKINFIGIDPLLVPKKREYCFLQGVGEYLPFSDEIADQVIIAGTLDHIINPLAVLKEAKRVLKKEGEINIWISVIEPVPQRRINLIKRAINLIRKGDFQRLIKGVKKYNKEILLNPEDNYHFHRFTKEKVISLIKELDMEVSRCIFLDEVMKYLFLKIKK